MGERGGRRTTSDDEWNAATTRDDETPSVFEEDHARTIPYARIPPPLFHTSPAPCNRTKQNQTNSEDQKAELRILALTKIEQILKSSNGQTSKCGFSRIGH